MKRTVSKATLANWERLGSEDKQLIHRANKTESLRKIFPDKYISNKNNKSKILAIADWIVTQQMDSSAAICGLALQAVYSSPHVSAANQDRFYQAAVQVCPHLPKIPADEAWQIDLTEPDFLGALYQTLQAEGARNKNGLYYTPAFVADRLLGQLEFTADDYILDPAVGTGIFLCELVRRFGVPVAQVHGTDIDPVAVLLATANLLLQAPANDNTYPDLRVCDYLQSQPVAAKRPDVVVGNPPWGAKKLAHVLHSELGRADSFAYFIEKSLADLADSGTLAFVLPVSLLNIATHEPVRQLLLAKSAIATITKLPRLFQGVVSDVCLLVVRKTADAVDADVKFEQEEQRLVMPQAAFARMPHHNFLPLRTDDRQILHHIWQQEHDTLAHSTWGLGIVTGNNGKYVVPASTDSDQQVEPLITGKEIHPYVVDEPQRYLKFERANFQQVALDEIYRAPEKLVYKFINNRLIFAYDDQQRLTLNSANILLPNVATHSLKTVLAYLNSELFQYLNQILFASSKVLRGNLEQLPFVKLSVSERVQLEELVDSRLAGTSSMTAEIDNFVFAKYRLSPAAIARIKQVLASDVFA